MPKPDEVAILTVNEQQFQDWETVSVQLRYHESFSYFRFTAAERDDGTKLAQQAPFNIPLWQKLQFKPGDRCEVSLAGWQVIDGFIETRQVAYNANSHAVELIGKSLTAAPYKSSVDTDTGNFDNMTIEQVARKVLAKYPVAVLSIGNIDQTPFKQLQNQPGEKIWDFLERLARVRGVILGSDPFGKALLIGDRAEAVISQLIEGVNIKHCQCVITTEHAYTEHDVRGQTGASDDQHGTQASEQQAAVSGAPQPVQSKLITVADQPVWTLAELYSRARYEAKWTNASIFTVTIIVQGWLADGFSLWQPGKMVFVRSPMIMCDELMAIETVEFTQDNNNGTQTKLDLKYPWALNVTNYDASNPNTPSPGGTPTQQQ